MKNLITWFSLLLILVWKVRGKVLLIETASKEHDTTMHNKRSQAALEQPSLPGRHQNKHKPEKHNIGRHQNKHIPEKQSIGKHQNKQILEKQNIGRHQNQ